MISTLQTLRKHVTIGMVGGSNLAKQKSQIGDNGKRCNCFAQACSELTISCCLLVLDLFDFTFAENGLVAFEGATKIHEMELKHFLPEEDIKQLINFLLHYIADLDIPVKR
jgi:phosphomannomutase